MKKPYDIDPQLRFLKPLRFQSYSDRRRRLINALMRVAMYLTTPRINITTKTYHINGDQDGRLKVKLYAFKNQDRPVPCILYLHGGGFQIEGTPIHLKLITNLMQSTGFKALHVQYRLTPKHPFPTAMEDCYQALCWLDANKTMLGITDIMVAGDSAGGNLATVMTLLARDRKGPVITRQLMIYPVIDVRQQTHSVMAYDDTPVWNKHLNSDMWTLYLKNGDHGMRQYASPILADLHDLPPAYLETAEYDCLRDEGIAYAERLRSFGVSVEAHHTKRSVHGYDGCFLSDLVTDLTQKRIAFLKGGDHEEN